MILKQQNKNTVSFIAYKLKPSHNLKVRSKQKRPKPTITMDPQQTNPIYNHLRNERNNKNIMTFILGFTSSQKSQRSSTISRGRSYSPNFQAFSKNQRITSSRQLQRFRSRGEKIFLNADRMTTELKKNKRKITILDQYNDLVDRYCELVPKIKTQNDKQVLIAHRQIEKLCTEQALAKEQDIGKRASVFRHYQEPKLNIRMFKQKTRLINTSKPQTVQISQDGLKRHNTYSF